MEFYLSISIFCLVTSITPGPNNIMLMTSGLNHGVLKTAPHFLGIVVGFPLMFAALGFGLGTLFLRYPMIHQIIKILGTGYLLFLAWKIANATNNQANDQLKKPLTFLQAAAFQWLNPKAWVIAIGAIATFTSIGNMASEVITIIIGYLILGSLSMAVWLLLGTSLQRIIRSDRQLRLFNIFMAILLLLSVIPIAIMQIDVVA